MRPIDADALLQRVERWRDMICDTYGKNDEYADCLAEVVMKIEDAPTIDVPDRKVGKWGVIMDEPTITFDECKCSECGAVEYFNKGWKKFNYCPNCGSLMKGEDNE